MATQAPAAPAAPAPKSAPKATAKDGFTVKQNRGESKTMVYEIVNGGGIITVIKSEATYYDPKEGRVRGIRYCPNEASIYTDEQGQFARRDHVIFRDKILVVPENMPNLREFLDKHPGNQANGGRSFRAVDNTKSAESIVDKEFLQVEAVSMIRDRDIQDLLPVALNLGVNINQSNIEIKRELLREAKANPDRFIKMFDSPEVKVRSAIMQATEFQILSAKPDAVRWFDSNNLIVSVPAGQDSIDIMTRFCLTDKGAPVYEEILARLNS